MLDLFKKFLAPKANPIGVDFGSDSLKLAQIQIVDGEPQLVAAASADVPSHVRYDPAARIAFFVQTVRELLASGDFRGRQAILGLPAAWMFIQHLRLPRLDDEGTRKALPWEARGKLPIDPSQAILRHVIAGEIYQDQEPRNEVILMAAGKDLVNQYLTAAAKARLDVVGMNVEPTAVVNCFGHIYRRRTDGDVVNCFVDIGASGSRAVIARGGQILFARAIAVGGDHLTRATASALGISAEDAKLLRLQIASSNPLHTESQTRHEVEPATVAVTPAADQFALLDSAMAAARHAEVEGGNGSSATAVLDTPAKPHPRSGVMDPATQARRVEQACREPLDKLVEELNLCRRYYEATFPNRPVDRIIFIGGESRHRSLCQYVAQEMGLAAQVGDPLVRMGRTTQVGIESGIDRRQPQPAWCTAIGLSLGDIHRPPATPRSSIDEKSLQLSDRRQER